MKLNRKFVIWGIFSALLLSSTSSIALTLGRVRGAVLLGKPLDVSVLVQFGADEQVGADCFSADVHYGDSAVERSRITLTSLPAAQPNTQIVRVTASSGVDEALVRLTLHSVCGAKSKRSYTILSDVASDLAGAAAAPGTMPLAAAAPRSQPLAAAPLGPAKTSSTKSSTRPARLAEAKPVYPAKKPVAAAAKSKATLNVEMLEDLQRRVDEIAKVQASSSNSAEELQTSVARANAMETDIQGLKVVMAKNQTSVEVLASALESSRSDNYGRSLVYALAALLLASIAALVYVGVRRRSAGVDSKPWWSVEGMRPQTATVTKPVSDRSAVTANAPTVAFEAAPDAAKNAELAAAAAVAASRRKAAAAEAVSFKEPSAPVAVAVEFAAVSVEEVPAAIDRPARQDFVNSSQATMRSINTREMLDVRQQAEFFMALGQHDEAVRLLESSIQGNAQSNPLVYLDLLKIFHTLSRRTDFERLRADFNAQFTGRIPPYSDFLAEGNGLEAYEDICNQVVVLWPTEYTIDYIEQCMVRLPADDPEQGMDMEAFRDLLLLYGVLKRLDQGEDSSRAPFGVSRQDQSVDTSFNTITRPEVTVPTPVSHVAYEAPASKTKMDLDLDLDLNLPEQPGMSGDFSNLIDFDVSSELPPIKKS